VVLIINNEKDISIFNNKQFIQIKDICEIKELNESPYTVLLLDVAINDEGVIEEFNFFFEEIIITLDIIAVITNKENKKLREICDFHKISLLEI